MLPVLTSAEMREADRRTIQEVGLPGAVLMENAGAAVAVVIASRFPGVRRPVILCGKGNNGGDGFVVARHLLALEPTAYLFAARSEVRGDALVHMGAFERSGGHLVEVPDATAWDEVRSQVLAARLLVDALLGTGLRQEPTGLLGRVIREVQASRGGGRSVVAVDIPSGVSSDMGEAAWESLTADLTVTFAARKYGHVLAPACDGVGEVLVADIGIPRTVIDAAGPKLWLLERPDAAQAFLRRDPGSHKGSFGRVLVIAGSVGKTGAAILAASGALRMGAGLVTVATPAPALPLVAQGRVELMTESLPVGSDGRLSSEAAARACSLAKACDAVVLGPGLGQDSAAREFVREFVARCPGPLVIDADGLNALAAGPRVAAALELLRRDRPTIVTPHPGEMARLEGTTVPEVQRRRLETARALAMASGAHVVLKGHQTIVADASGRAAVNPTGNPGMASGGTGDVLAGMVGALLGRGLPAWVAATSAVYVHGLAGDLAATRLGQEALLAGDLLDALPEALRSLEASDS